MSNKATKVRKYIKNLINWENAKNAPDKVVFSFWHCFQNIAISSIFLLIFPTLFLAFLFVNMPTFVAMLEIPVITHTVHDL